MAELCGCNVDIRGEQLDPLHLEQITITARMTYCPLHQAAPKLLAALEDGISIAGFYRDLLRRTIPGASTFGTDQWLAEAQAVIAEARPKRAERKP